MLFRFWQMGLWKRSKSRTGLLFLLFFCCLPPSSSLSCFRKVQDQRACGNHWWDIKVKVSWSTHTHRGNNRQTKQNVLANFWKPVYWFQWCASPQISLYSSLTSLLSSCVIMPFLQHRAGIWLAKSWFLAHNRFIQICFWKQPVHLSQ